jgi:hypothetical protein
VVEGTAEVTLGNDIRRAHENESAYIPIGKAVSARGATRFGSAFSYIRLEKGDGQQSRLYYGVHNGIAPAVMSARRPASLCASLAAAQITPHITIDGRLTRANDVLQPTALPQHFLNFLPDPQGHGSLRPTLLGDRCETDDGPGVSGIEICFGPFLRQ